MTSTRTRRALAALILTLGTAGLPLQPAQADQPRMAAALEHLRAARVELEAASNDKGGHRLKAIALVDKAIRQVEQGMKFDRRH